MSGQPTIEITPGVLRLGAEVIQLAHVTSLRVRRRRPLLVPAVGLLLLGLGLLASEALAGRIGLGGGSVSLPRLVAAGLLVGLGLLLPIYARQTLVVALSDRSRRRVVSPDRAFLDRLTHEIVNGMRAEPGSDLHIVGDAAARTLGSLPRATTGGQRALPPSTGAGTPRPAGQPHPTGAPGPRSQTVSPHPRTAPPAGPAGAPASLQGAPLSSILAASSGPPLPGAMGLPSGPAAGPSRLDDIARLVTAVQSGDVPHKETLLTLLAVVEDYVKGGPTPREDAVAYWKSFSDYVFQYLSRLEPIPTLTRSTGRSLGLE